MLEVILDTETTGLSPSQQHRIVEIGCIELDNLIPTNKIFHEYLNPERKVSEDAFKVHGYSNDFLASQKKFSEIADRFLEFIKDKKIIIHNAAFDLSFLNYELGLVNKKKIEKKSTLDTLEIARQKYPGSQNSLDALCKRLNIDNSKRCGVELDKPIGKNNGTIKNHKYFTCKEKHGVLVVPWKITFLDDIPMK